MSNYNKMQESLKAFATAPYKMEPDYTNKLIESIINRYVKTLAPYGYEFTEISQDWQVRIPILETSGDYRVKRGLSVSYRIIFPDGRLSRKFTSMISYRDENIVHDDNLDKLVDLESRTVRLLTRLENPSFKPRRGN